MLMRGSVLDGFALAGEELAELRVAHHLGVVFEAAETRCWSAGSRTLLDSAMFVKAIDSVAA